MVFRAPIDLCLSLRTKSAHLFSIQAVVANLDSLSLSGITSVGPRVDAWVIETSVFELGAIDWGLSPCLRVCIVGAVVIITGVRRVEHLHPL